MIDLDLRSSQSRSDERHAKGASGRHQRERENDHRPRHDRGDRHLDATGIGGHYEERDENEERELLGGQGERHRDSGQDPPLAQHHTRRHRASVPSREGPEGGKGIGGT